MTRTTTGIVSALAGVVTYIVAARYGSEMGELVGQLVVAVGAAIMSHGLQRRVPRGAYAKGDRQTGRSEG